MNWISVNDRLPENENFVLAVFYGDCVEVDACWYRESSGFWYQKNESLNVNIKITHWMPFPEPPCTK